MSDNMPLRLGITVGDAAGIGLEVLYGALHSLPLNTLDIRLYAHPDTVSEYYDRLFGKNQWSLPSSLTMVPTGDYAPIDFGNPNAIHAQAAIASLEQTGHDAKQGLLDAIVTLPIAKKILQEQGWHYPGQTEFYADICKSGNSYMMILCTRTVRVALTTIHIPLSMVSGHISASHIDHTLHLFTRSLIEDFGIEKPRIAVLGLNPHAGEGGTIGTEEATIIEPALRQFSHRTGHHIEGCFPADGFFAHGSYGYFDGILAMYHDQGLIPLKMLATGGGVNMTAGLPIVRTSPDHGTAYGIAGQKKADSSSMAEALVIAADIAVHRRKYRSKGVSQS